SGFHITWTSQPVGNAGCGGYFDNDDGIIISPNYPNSYQQNQECFWQIHVGETGKILFTITNMDIEDHAECGWDYLELRDGPDETAPLIGRFCGQIPPPSITSLSNNLWLKFRSDEAQVGSGFRATYTVSCCGGVYTSSVGSLQSPGHPTPYPHGANCTYYISVHPSLLINLHFIAFALEDADINGVCSDFVEVFDGPSSNAVSLGRFCGSYLPPDTTSSGHELRILFSAGDSINDDGFAAAYSTVNARCGGSLTTSDGYFQSPNFPFAYDHNTVCTWLIDISQGSSIRLLFTTFEVLPFGTCDNDFIEVFDGPTQGYPSFGRNCGSTLPAPIESRTNQLFVKFQTDQSQSGSGFAAQYHPSNSSTSSCGGELTAESGHFNSPNYPDVYPTSADCVWMIRSAPGNRIALSFLSFDLEVSDSCKFDYVQIREGPTIASPLIGRFCGKQTPSNIVYSTSNYLTVQMVSDGSVGTQGFNASYQQACGGILIGDSGAVTSPNYPNDYPPNTIDCYWILTAPTNEAIQLDFKDFAIESHSQCEKDYVLVMEGHTGDGEILGKFCGTDQPSTTKSSGNEMTVRFRSDSSTQNRGFEAIYKIASCGGTLVGVGGTITSPNYPFNYPEAVSCQWVVRGPAYHFISFVFDDLDLDTTTSCGDYLAVRSYNFTGPIIATVCGRSAPDVIESETNEVYITFVSDAVNTSLGFSLTYTASEDGCGGLVVGTTNGVITSPNYPAVYNNHDYCLWTIAVPEGRQINLRWTNFTIELHSSCRFDYLKLYNGPTTDSPLIDTYCGTNEPTEFQSGGNTVTILFQSDFSVTHGGWRMEWKE
uniref:CUB domain-containing protein n=1 Tax=Ciona savignyi TaxID=51511 RepID=H2YKV3_CIOSA